MENEYKKIIASEVVAISLFLWGLDGGAAMVDTTLIGMLIVPVGQAGVLFLLDEFFFKPKGGHASGKLGKQIAKYAAGVIPWVPTTVLIFYVECYLHNHPQITRTVKKTIGAASALKAAKATKAGMVKKLAAGRQAYKTAIAEYSPGAEKDKNVSAEQYAVISARLHKTAANLKQIAKPKTTEI